MAARPLPNKIEAPADVSDDAKQQFEAIQQNFDALSSNDDLFDEDAITALTGDVTATGPGSVAATIANDAVTDAKLRDSAGLSVIGRSASSTGDPADIVAGTDAYVLRRSGAALGFGQVATGGIADGAVTPAKLEDLAASTLLGRGSAAGTGDPQAITLGAGTFMSGTVLASTGARRTVGIVIDGGGSVIATGVKGYIRIPSDLNATIQKVTVLADQSGSIVVDVWKDTYANYPPTDADSITAAAPPTLSAAIKSEDSTLTGWTTSISGGDVLGFNVDSATTVTRVIVEIELLTTGVTTASPVGGDTQVQFNDGGAMAGDADLTWNKTTNLLSATGGYKERSRTTPMGEWTNVAFDAGNFTSDAGTWTVESADQISFKYTLIGRTMFVDLYIDSTSVSGAPAELQIAVPGGHVISGDRVSLVYVLDAGSPETGRVTTSNGGTKMRFNRIVAGTWSNSTNLTYLRASIFFAIQ